MVQGRQASFSPGDCVAIAEMRENLLIIINLSLPRRRESSDVKRFWIPAFAGMTFLEVNLIMLRILKLWNPTASPPWLPITTQPLRGEGRGRGIGRLLTCSRDT